ncbi:hypothetical protein OH799_07005 [Nocardia sp. NBC_00881]|uniref:Dyp-type peroxidase n=1 Tax=Nocardia sp. NBC_00881 TaxID=2975995 RepID=UPI003867D001|nr:hypothetical protein OH799_07005 [Nocardia sp. NBC_00881]
MAIDLTQTAIDPDNGGIPPTRNTKQALENALNDMQGNILKSHGRNHSVHLFITFKNGTAADRQNARDWLAKLADKEAVPHVTSAMRQWEEAKAYRAALQIVRDNGKFATAEQWQRVRDASDVFVGVMLSIHGYRDLALGAGLTPDDPAFIVGAKNRVNDLHDPPMSQWDKKFQHDLHALVVLADDDAESVGLLATTLKDELEGISAAVEQEIGTAMRLDAKGHESPTAPVREHFGFVDGISQPLFFASDIEQARTRHGGIDQYDPSAPLGQVLVKDPAGGPDGYGSYFVYRKLKQDVYGFRADKERLAAKIAEYAHPESEHESPKPTEAHIALAGAYMVGRFQDGTPVVNRALAGQGELSNNFTFDADVDGIRCPFQAHVRKSNPRGDKLRQFGVPVTQERSRRIARRAISYGPVTLEPKDGEEVGLLFLCAQSSIADQFEFIQVAWANNEDFLRSSCGLDPVIGARDGGPPKDEAERAKAAEQPWPKLYGSRNELDFGKNPPQYTDWFFRQRVGQWVTMRGGEYFFVPSLSALKKFGTVVEPRGEGN